MVILFVDLEMLVQIADAVGQQGNLDLRGPRVCVVQLVLVNQLILLFCC